MGLTGKCKQDFEAWFSREFYAPKIPNMTAMSVWEFYKFPLSMQFGVIQEWADSVGYGLGVINSFGNHGVLFSGFVRIPAKKISGEFLGTRQEAQLAAISKLNEIYNER